MIEIVNRFAAPDTPDAELEILLWDPHWFPDSYNDPLVALTPNGARIIARFSTDRSRVADADAIWVHPPTMRQLPPKRDNQPWVLCSMEADHNYPFQTSPAADALFDITMTYHRGSDVPTPYANRAQYNGFVRTRSRPHRADAIASFIASNPVPERDDYVTELMHHVPIAAFGTCLRNREFDEIVGTGLDRGQAAEMAIASYGFSLAFENCLADEYVTEKLYRPLALGTIPVYWGAPDLTGLVPDRTAVVEVTNEEPAELADLMVARLADTEWLEAILDWPNRPAHPDFDRLLDVTDIDPRARLATKIAHGCDSSCRCGGRLDPTS